MTKEGNWPPPQTKSGSELFFSPSARTTERRKFSYRQSPSLEKEFSSCFHLCIADVVLRLKQNRNSLNRQLRTLIFFLKKVFVENKVIVLQVQIFIFHRKFSNLHDEKISALSPGQALQELGKNFSCPPTHTCNLHILYRIQ